MVEQEGNDVAQDLPEQPARQMPQIARPHPLYTVSLHELGEDSIYAVAKATQEGAPLGVRVSLLGGVWSQKLYAHSHQLLPGLWRVVVAIPNDQARGSLGDLRQHGKLVGVGWGHRKTSDHPRPTNPHVYSEAVEGLLEESVFAEGGLPAEATAAVGAGEQARWQGERVGQELLPEALLDLPEVGCLARESGAVYPPQVREEVSVVAPEVGKKLRIFVEPQELADNLDGDDLRVKELRGGSARPRRRPSSAMRSSMRQKTLRMKVLRSTRAKTSFSLR